MEAEPEVVPAAGLGSIGFTAYRIDCAERMCGAPGWDYVLGQVWGHVWVWIQLVNR
jgi:hypothetical protein